MESEGVVAALVAHPSTSFALAERPASLQANVITQSDFSNSE
jgi:hypothetical protein